MAATPTINPTQYTLSGPGPLRLPKPAISITAARQEENSEESKQSAAKIQDHPAAHNNEYALSKEAYREENEYLKVELDLAQLDVERLLPLRKEVNQLTSAYEGHRKRADEAHEMLEELHEEHTEELERWSLAYDKLQWIAEALLLERDRQKVEIAELRREIAREKGDTSDTGGEDGWSLGEDSRESEEEEEDVWMWTADEWDLD